MSYNDGGRGQGDGTRLARSWQGEHTVTPSGHAITLTNRNVASDCTEKHIFTSYYARKQALTPAYTEKPRLGILCKGPRAGGEARRDTKRRDEQAKKEKKRDSRLRCHTGSLCRAKGDTHASDKGIEFFSAWPHHTYPTTLGESSRSRPNGHEKKKDLGRGPACRAHPFAFVY